MWAATVARSKHPTLIGWPKMDACSRTVSSQVMARAQATVHASAACSPTRAMLLSGTDSHLAGCGVMSEQRGGSGSMSFSIIGLFREKLETFSGGTRKATRDISVSRPKTQDIRSGHVAKAKNMPPDDDVAPLPELLRSGGYHTMMSGKWHLGLRPDNNPAARGFDRSFALLPGASNHWGFEPQFNGDSNAFFDRIPVLYTEDNKRSVVWVLF